MRTEVRILLVVALLLSAAGCLTCGVIAFNSPLTILQQSQVVFTEPRVPKRFQRNITYSLDPMRDESERITVDGAKTFSKMYREAWFESLEAFVFQRNYPGTDVPMWKDFDQTWVKPWSISLPAELSGIRKAGWLRCHSQIDRLLRHEPEDALRSRILDEMRSRKTAQGLSWFGGGTILLLSSIFILRKNRTDQST